MSPNQVFPLESGPGNPIARRVLAASGLTYEVTGESVVIAVAAELLVRRQAREASPEFDRQLRAVARDCGTLATLAGSDDRDDDREDDRDDADSQSRPADRGQGRVRIDASGPAGDVEIWRLTQPNRNSIDEARRLRLFADDCPPRTCGGGLPSPPAVTPNHVAILAPEARGCPASSPVPAPPPRDPFIDPLPERPAVRVTILDSGYIRIGPPGEPHTALDERVTLVAGEWLDTVGVPPSWRPDEPDGLYLDSEGELDGITGHGTFIAGLVAHICPDAVITVVGLRDQEGPVDSPKSGLFASEVAIARALLRNSDTDVIQCGFAFPTLGNAPSLPFAAALEILKSRDGPRGGAVAVVAPAGNESSAVPYWPAAFPGVIGVAATDRRGDGRVHFSNWGRWCDCCCRGEDVYSTFVDFSGPIDGEPVTQIEHFTGWAYWDGTSFAAPKVSAAIARRVAESGGALTPMQAWAELVAGGGGVAVSTITDYTLAPFPGVSLPQLWLG